MKILYVYLSMLVTFFAIDMVWLGLVAKKFYANQLGDLMADSPNWLVAIIFYACYIVGIYIFAVRPALVSGSVMTGLIYGALFGFFCYATYDFTNLATLKNWPTTMVYVDIIWGIVITGTTALIGSWVALKLGTSA